MSRKAILIALAVVSVLAVAAVLWMFRPPAGEMPDEPADFEPDGAPESFAAAEEVRGVSLYFPGGGRRLYPERREVPWGVGVAERATALVEALLSGPASASRRPPLPEGVALRDVYLVSGGRIFLDFESPEEAPPPSSGSEREMLAVYSLVNTVLLNLDEAEELVLLWNSRQLETFAGHLDVSRPLSPNPSLNAPAAVVEGS